MDGKKKMPFDGKNKITFESSTPSVADSIFGPKEPAVGSAGYFDSIFPAYAKSPKREPVGAEEKNQAAGKFAETKKPEDGGKKRQAETKKPEDGFGKSSKGKVLDKRTQDLNEVIAQAALSGPCYMSSGVLYGGPDIIDQPYESNAPTYSTTFDDIDYSDPRTDPRGNWWQGGAYY